MNDFPKNKKSYVIAQVIFLINCISEYFSQSYNIWLIPYVVVVIECIYLMKHRYLLKDKLSAPAMIITGSILGLFLIATIALDISLMLRLVISGIGVIAYFVIAIYKA